MPNYCIFPLAETQIRSMSLTDDDTTATATTTTGHKSNKFHDSIIQKKLDTFDPNNCCDSFTPKNSNHQIQHTFIKKKKISKNFQTSCDICSKTITNETSYLECQDCSLKIHKECISQVKNNCKSQLIHNDTWSSDEFAQTSQDQDQNSTDNDNANLDSPNTDKMKANKKLKFDQDGNDIEGVSPSVPVPVKSALSTIDENQKNKHSDIRIIDDYLSDNSGHEMSDSNDSNKINSIAQKRLRYKKVAKKPQHIGLQRLSQRVKNTSPGGIFWAGHLVYYTNLENEVTFSF
jgi:hypothetical protein